MTTQMFNPPEPVLTARRLASLGAGVRAHLPNDLAHRRPLSRRAIAATAVTLVAGAFGAAAIAVAFDPLSWISREHQRDDTGQFTPRLLGNYSFIARGDDWALVAWRSNRGICLDYAFEDRRVAGGTNGWSGCGFPVVGAPPDEVFKQPTNTDVIGFIGGAPGGGLPWAVAGPVSQEVAKVVVTMQDGSTSAASLFSAPDELGVNLRFYLLRGTTPSGSGRGAPVESVSAYDASGGLLEVKPAGTG